MISSNQKGFTLIELVTSIVIISISLIVVFMIFKSFTDVNSMVMDKSEAIQRIQQITTFLNTDIKNLKNKNSIITATSTRFQFIHVNNNVIDFVFYGNQLKKNNIVLCSDIYSANIQYFKWDGLLWTPSSPTRDIAVVTFNISIKTLETIISFKHSIVLRNSR